MTARLALVTGESSGIGQHLVGTPAAAGYAVAFSYRSSREGAEETVRRERDAGRAVLPIRCDVWSKSDMGRFVAQAVDWHGDTPDVLVDNAGPQTWSGLLDLAEDRWNDVLRTSLKGGFLHTQADGGMMAQSGRGGAIVNIGSGCNKLAFPKLVDYTASKGGVDQFTRAAAVELGPMEITVNCVAPGAIMTDRTREEGGDYAAQ